jgi:hypothetical protein
MVGIRQIAERLRVSKQTVARWQRRGLLPAPDSNLGDEPAWDWHGVEEWARATGRLEPRP